MLTESGFLKAARRVSAFSNGKRYGHGSAMLSEIGRYRADDHSLTRHAAMHDVCPVFQFSGPHRQIMAVVDEVGDAVVKRRVEFDLWKTLCE
jgi:hypothetical protein